MTVLLSRSPATGKQASEPAEPGKQEAAEAQPQETAAVQEPVTAAAQAQQIAVSQEQETAAVPGLVTAVAQELVTAAAQQEQVSAECRLGARNRCWTADVGSGAGASWATDRELAAGVSQAPNWGSGTCVGQTTN